MAKPHHTFDDEPGPRKTPVEGLPVQPPAPAPATPAAAASAPKRITQMVPAKPPVVAAPVSPLLSQLAVQPLHAPPSEPAAPPAMQPAAPAKPAFLQAGAGHASHAADAFQPRSTTIASTLDAEMGSTFISGRVKLQVMHFPAPNARRRILIVNEIPGTQQNLDLAQALWLNGYEVAILHNRGEAGSDGHFSPKGIEKDVRACCQQTVETGHRDRLWKSVAPVVIVGSGVCAPGLCGIAAEDERLGGLALIEPYVVIPRLTELGNSPIQPVELYHHMQAGVISMIGREMLNDEWDYLAQFRNPMEMAEKGTLDHMPILHVTAERSILADMGRRFSTALKKRNAPLYHHVHLPGTATHFWRNRQELIDVVSFWIDELK